MSSMQEEKPATDAKTQIRELRNTELVSRLLAATPPYLYSALPLQPHAFFFSEMLRSFVNARHGCRPPHYHRRFKRRSHKYFAENDSTWRKDWTKQEEDRKESDTRPEVPLELTVEKQRSREESPKRQSPKPELRKSSESPSTPGRQSAYVDVGTEEMPKPSPCVGRNPTDTNSIPSSNLILPPPPPMWYPPIYNPQFGVDPLNFFIDLRVSGHIYDKKRSDSNGTSQDVRPEEIIADKPLGKDFGQRPRHLSAFTVPVRSINPSNDVKVFDNISPDKLHVDGHINGTSYIMRNLRSVYDNVKTAQDVNDTSTKDENNKDDSTDIEDDIID